jgi:hypothetical protein
MISKTVFTAIVSVLGLCGVLLWRVREGRTAVTARKLLIPPMGMANSIHMAEVEVERYGNDLGLCSLLKDPWPQKIK